MSSVERTVRKDYTVRWRNRVFLIEERRKAIKKRKVEVVENLEGEIRIWFNTKNLEYREITEGTVKRLREKRKENEKDLKEKPKQKWKPSEDHPWRHQVIGS